MTDERPPDVGWLHYRLAVAVCSAFVTGVMLLLVPLIVSMISAAPQLFVIYMFVFSKWGAATLLGSAVIGFLVGGERMANFFAIIWGTHRFWLKLEGWLYELGDWLDEHKTAGTFLAVAFGLLVVLLFALAATALAGANAGDFDYKVYRPSSLSGAVAEHQKSAAVDFLVETGNFKYAVGVTYTGRHRETAAPTKELIRRWVKALRHPKEYETLFDHEVEVESGGKKYWLPIQNPMVQSFASEVRAGGPVKLYIILLGATKDTWVFAINEFQRQ